jgi:hypothetical protein
MNRLAILTLVPLLLAAAPLAQRAPRADVLLANWADQQSTAFEAMRGYAFEETVDRQVEGTHFQRRILTVQRVEVGPGGTNRRVIRASIDGAAVSPDTLAHMARRLERAHGPDLQMVSRVTDLPAHHLARLRPAGPLVAEEINGMSVWRLDMRPSRRRGGPETVTLWFDRSSRPPSVLRSAVMVRGQSPETHFTVTTDYQHVHGPAGAVALPARQRVDGAIQHQRRWRTFTVLLNTERVVRDVRIDWD